jgi:Protein of unknown function (DUF4239)
MSEITISAIVFACVFGGALAGMRLRTILPEHHRNAESKDLVRAAVALIGTISALVLGLLVASAKSSFDAQTDELKSLSAQVVLLDRVLAAYGPEAKDTRDLVREVVAGARDEIWNGGSRGKRADTLYTSLHKLSPKDADQQSLKAEALSLVLDLAKTRFLMVEQRDSSVSTPLLVVVVFWLSINFVSFGIFSDRNATVGTTLFVCALSVAGAIFLILEMDRPFEGLIRISDAPLRQALLQMVP